MPLLNTYGEGPHNHSSARPELTALAGVAVAETGVLQGKVVLRPGGARELNH
jgi:hypothetical protein